MPYAVDLLDKDRVIEDLKRVQEFADFVVVCPHWGKECVICGVENNVKTRVHQGISQLIRRIKDRISTAGNLCV